MELLLWSGVFLVSLAALVKASDWFVLGAERVGISLGVPSFIIGVTVVAFGTSLPELASSISAVIGGSSDIVIGNVVGSNITNILLIMGLVAVFGKGRMETKRNLLDIDMPMLIISALMLWFLIRDRDLSMFDTAILLVAMGIFISYAIAKDGEEPHTERQPVDWKMVLLAVGSLVLLYFSADYTVFSIQKVSDLLGIGTGVIALSVVALGTSLPEVLVSVTAARRGNPEIAFGNVIGSNIFNTFAVMSIPRFFGKLEIAQDVIDFSLPLMVAASFLLIVMLLAKRISKYEGMMLLLLYVLFLAGLFGAV
jgi:cation:H+ antiporter